MKLKGKPRGRPFRSGESANPYGRPRSHNPKKNRMSVRATDEEWEELKARAASIEVSVMQYVRSLIWPNNK